MPLGRNVNLLFLIRKKGKRKEGGAGEEGRMPDGRLFFKLFFFYTVKRGGSGRDKKKGPRHTTLNPSFSPGAPTKKKKGDVVDVRFEQAWPAPLCWGREGRKKPSPSLFREERERRGRPVSRGRGRGKKEKTLVLTLRTEGLPEKKKKEKREERGGAGC